MLYGCVLSQWQYTYQLVSLLASTAHTQMMLWPTGLHCRDVVLSAQECNVGSQGSIQRQYQYNTFSSVSTMVLFFTLLIIIIGMLLEFL